MARLLDDDEIRALHDEAVAAHCATRDRLLADPDYRQLRDQLKACPKQSPAELALKELIET